MWRAMDKGAGRKKKGGGGGWLRIWYMYGISRVSKTTTKQLVAMFWPWNLISKRSNTILWKFQELSFALPGICSTKVKKFQGFFKKVYPQHITPPPSLFVFVFFWKSPIMVKLKNVTNQYRLEEQQNKVWSSISSQNGVTGYK